MQWNSGHITEKWIESKPFLGKAIYLTPAGLACLKVKCGRQCKKSPGPAPPVTTTNMLMAKVNFSGCEPSLHPLCPHTTPSWSTVLQSLDKKITNGFTVFELFNSPQNRLGDFTWNMHPFKRNGSFSPLQKCCYPQITRSLQYYSTKA